jgi:hypothetical protein
MIHPTPATKKSKRQRNQDPSPQSKDNERAPRVSESPQRTDSSEDEMDDQEIPSPRTHDGQSSALDDEDLLLQDQPQAHTHARPYPQRREVSRLNPFDQAPPFLPDDYDDWALSFKLYCSPDIQDFLKAFDHPSQRPVTQNDHELNGWLMKII